MSDEKTPNKSSRKWRRLAAKAMRRSGGTCEWVRTDVYVRCARAATTVDMTRPDGDLSLGNLKALCEYHQLMAERSREVAKFIAIRVRPPRGDDKKDK